MDPMDDVYELVRRGTELLEAGHNHQATIPLSRARDLDPDKTSIREALGRALFGAQRYEQAAIEFEAVIDRAPTNDYAQFCLGRSLQMLGVRSRSPRAFSREGATTAFTATAPGARRPARRTRRAAGGQRAERVERPNRCYPGHTAVAGYSRQQYRKWAIARFFYEFADGGDRELDRTSDRDRKSARHQRA